jgi:AcrR family transcriptional regulator
MGLSTTTASQTSNGQNATGRTSTAPRRDPVQERSQETVGRIQAAAARLLARGTAAHSLTTAQIATEAALSVGALYRFFPDKQAIIDAIALAHLEAFQDELAGLLLADMPDTPTGFLAAIIDAFAAYLGAHPDFRTLAYGTPAQPARAISPALFEREAGEGALAELLRESLVTLFGLEPDADFPFRLRIAAELGDRLIAHAFAQPDPALRQRILDEAKSILAPYLFPAG